jgi:hypothetical protein
MKKLTMTGGAVAICLVASMASAATPKAAAPAAAKSADVTGKIRSVDVVNDVVTLESGVFYQLPAAIKLDGFKAGDQVTISPAPNETHEAKSITKG